MERGDDINSAVKSTKVGGEGEGGGFANNEGGGGGEDATKQTNFARGNVKLLLAAEMTRPWGWNRGMERKQQRFTVFLPRDSTLVFRRNFLDKGSIEM